MPLPSSYAAAKPLRGLLEIPGNRLFSDAQDPLALVFACEHDVAWRSEAIAVAVGGGPAPALRPNWR